MKLAFAGTSSFAAVSLEALLRARHEITLVLTQPDRPAGRGLRLQPSAVKRAALARGLPLLQPTALDAAALDAIARAAPEALVVVAYGLKLPAALLRLPPRGCLNVHASLLPRWRGAAPVQRALLAGDSLTGVTIMQMDEGLDTGPILLQHAMDIGDTETAGELHDRLAVAGAHLLIEALTSWPVPRAQDAAAATYALRITREEAFIDWYRPAADIERQVRAFNPSPGARTRLDGTALKIWQAHVEPARSDAPGTILEAGASGLLAACGSGALRITALQRAGARAMAASAFLAGFPVAAGTRFALTDD